MQALLLADTSKILICNDFDAIIQELKTQIPAEFLRIIEPKSDEFLLDDAKRAVEEAYIASDKPKTIVLKANKYRLEAQNSLLKILEEQPKNIIFILLAKSKSVFLATIKSRLVVVNLKHQEKHFCNIDIFNLTDEYVLEQIDIYSKKSKTEIKQMLYGVWQEIIKNNIKPNTIEQDVFNNSLLLLELNTKPISVLSDFFLTLQALLKKQK